MANITKAEREARLAADNAANPREPSSPVSDLREEPTTDAAAGFPVGTPGTFDPVPAEDPVAAAKVVKEAAARVPMFPVRIIRGYYPVDGSGKLKEGQEVELPIEEARRLIESGAAVRNDALPGI